MATHVLFNVCTLLMCVMNRVVSESLVNSIRMGYNGTFVVSKPSIGVDYRLKCPIGINDTFPTHEKCLLQTRLNTSQTDRNVTLEITKANERLEGNYKLSDENGTNALNLTLEIWRSVLIEISGFYGYDNQFGYYLDYSFIDRSADVIWMENDLVMNISPLIIYEEVNYGETSLDDYDRSYKDSRLIENLNKSIGILPSNSYGYQEVMRYDFRYEKN